METYRLMHLVADRGRWALKDNSMIFCSNIVLCEDSRGNYMRDARRYHLIEEDSLKEIPIGDIEDYVKMGDYEFEDHAD
jgi:hypothetical protein